MSNILDYLNPFSDNFIGKKIVDLIGDLLKFLFVPEDGYFENVIDTIEEDINTKIPILGMKVAFSEIWDVTEDGQIDDISINGLNIGGKNVSVPKFIDFSIITKYKVYWYSWVRAFIFIFLIIYNINQVMKLLRGIPIADGGKTGGDNK